MPSLPVLLFWVLLGIDWHLLLRDDIRVPLNFKMACVRMYAGRKKVLAPS